MIKKAKLYQPAKNAMQSGKAKDRWLLEYFPVQKKEVDNLMGWQGSGDMKQQVRIFFDTKEEGIAFAKKNNISFEVTEPRKPKIKIKSYTENFTS